MTVFVAWTGEELPPDVAGPWRELWPAAPGVTFVDSDESLSRVYHELKWSLPDGVPLVVAAVDGVPKLRGLAPGTLTWLREHSRPPAH